MSTLDADGYPPAFLRHGNTTSMDSVDLLDVVKAIESAVATCRPTPRKCERSRIHARLTRQSILRAGAAHRLVWLPRRRSSLGESFANSDRE